MNFEKMSQVMDEVSTLSEKSLKAEELLGVSVEVFANETSKLIDELPRKMQLAFMEKLGRKLSISKTYNGFRSENEKQEHSFY